MLKIGIQSGDLFNDKNFQWGLSVVKDAGFDCIDFNMDQKISHKDVSNNIKNLFFEQSDESLKEYYLPFKQEMEKKGITMSQMHGPFPIYCKDNPHGTDVLVNATIKCLMLCEFFGCPYLVVHPVKGDNQENEKEINLELYRRLMPYAKKYKTGICLENMFTSHNGHIIEAVCSDFRMAAWYIDTLNEEAGEKIFSFCFDLGHATLLGKNIRNSLNLLGERVTVLHIHDNDAVRDCHLQPYSTKRGGSWVTEWTEFLEGLRDIGYKGALSFETFNAVKDLPKELIPAMVNYIGAVGKYFSEVLK